MYRPAVIVWFFVACGQEQIPTLPQVVIASDQQIADLQVKANSYLVMFKTIAGLKQVRFHSYRAEVQHFAPFINNHYQFDNGIKDLRTITALEMPTFAVGSPFSALNWQQRQPTEVGVLVEATFTSNRLAAAHLYHWQQRGDIYFAEPNYLSIPANGIEMQGGWLECRENCSNENKTHQRCKVSDNREIAKNCRQACENLCIQGKLYEGYVTREDDGTEVGDTSSSEWWHDAINLPEAMRYIANRVAGVGGVDENLRPPEHTVLIAVFDSGIDYEHPSLAARVYKNEKGADYGCTGDTYGCNTTAATKDSLGNGETRPWGTNLAERQAQQEAGVGQAEVGGRCPDTSTAGYHSCSHGTHVAGIIVADGDIGKESNPRRMAGVCPFCKVINVRVLADVATKDGEKPRGGITDSALLNGLKYIDNMYWNSEENLRIINASIGKFHRSRSVALLISLLKERDGGGVLVIGAAGNEDTMARTYPAALNSVLAVSATDSNCQKSSFSNLGMWVDIAAPGGGGSGGNQILSTIPGENYQEESGTSMATPVVSGVAGLFLSVWADLQLEATLLEDYLIASSDHNKLYGGSSECNASFNHDYWVKIDTIDERVPLLGKGLVDAYRLVRAVTDNELARVDLESEEYRRVDWNSCGTIGSGSRPSIFLLLVALSILTLALRGFS